MKAAIYGLFSFLCAQDTNKYTIILQCYGLLWTKKALCGLLLHAESVPVDELKNGIKKNCYQKWYHFDNDSTGKRELKPTL
ncbi:MAG: hypothetical protein IKN64_01545 [Desulfovibrio sp.]|nr:hypothetical protein [Desulfovibrio sp.]